MEMKYYIIFIKILKHNPEQMRKIARENGGNFYNVYQLDNITKCFTDAIAGLKSVVGFTFFQ